MEVASSLLPSWVFRLTLWDIELAADGLGAVRAALKYDALLVSLLYCPCVGR